MAAEKTGNMVHLKTWGASNLVQCTPPSVGSDFGVYRELWGVHPPIGGVNNSLDLGTVV